MYPEYQKRDFFRLFSSSTSQRVLEFTVFVKKYTISLGIYVVLLFLFTVCFLRYKIRCGGQDYSWPTVFFHENDTGMVFFMLSLWEYRSYLDFSFTKVSDAFLFCIVRAAVPEAIFRGSVPYAGAAPFMMRTFSVFALTSFRL